MREKKVIFTKSTIMKKKYFFAVLASVALAGCSNDDFITESLTVQQPDVEQSDVPIQFGSLKGNTTRADITGADAAKLLGKQFVVSGYKGTTTAGYNADNIVFDNYLVQYAENTAHTTASNSSNWEYAGVSPIKHATDNGITSQKIKYWDYSQAQYDYIAWSTGTKTAVFTEGEIADGKVYVSAITPATATGTAADPARVAYQFKGAAADLSNCYIADMVTVKKTGTVGVGTVVGYGDNPVTFKFRQLGAKVRIGIYETVPGYSVKNVAFYSAAASNDATTTAVKLFTTTENDIYTSGTYTVTFPTVDKPDSLDNNQAHVSFNAGGAGQTTIVNWGGLNYTIREEGEKSADAIYLGRSSATASYAGEAEDNYYNVFLPNETGTNLNLRVNYTLESTDGSGEVINVKGATAQVPSIYTTWKPGFAYTYIFKISDKTNGYTGTYDPTDPDGNTTESNPAGLYPITFDAVVVNAEDQDASQENITLVSTPSITTYQQGSNVVNEEEYSVNGSNKIYVTVNENNAVVTLTGKAALYTIPAGKTEADVIDALQCQDDNNATGTIKGRSGLVLTNATSALTDSVKYGADGNAIVVGTNKALSFTPVASTVYAFVYTKTAATPANNVVRYQALAWESFTTGMTKYRYDYVATTKTHTYNDGSADVDAYDAQKGVKYFKAEGGVYTMQNPFLGQTVSNLYLDAAGNTIASGYAVTGTPYYYTTDGGQTYTAAHNVAYGSPKDAGLYTKSGDTYTLTTDETPQNGTAYYYRTGTGTVADPYVYTYCVFMPQQTNSWFVLDTNTYVKAEEASKVDGQTYFDKYTQNDGVYYTKVIKVQ